MWNYQKCRAFVAGAFRSFAGRRIQREKDNGNRRIAIQEFRDLKCDALDFKRRVKSD